VVADETGRRPAASTTRLRLRWLAVVVAIMALLTAGWPLLNSAVANRQPLTAGSRLTIGTGPASSGVVTVGRGWYLQPAESNPRQEYVLRKDGLELTISHVSLVNRGQIQLMWQGLRRILSVTDPGSQLSKPSTIRTGHRLRAMTGVVSGQRLIGAATIFPGPSGEFAIQMVVLAPRNASRALRAAAVRVMTSFIFTAQSR
jgi:hypothetical protein